MVEKEGARVRLCAEELSSSHNGSAIITFTLAAKRLIEGRINSWQIKTFIHPHIAKLKDQVAERAMALAAGLFAAVLSSRTSKALPKSAFLSINNLAVTKAYPGDCLSCTQHPQRRRRREGGSTLAAPPVYKTPPRTCIKTQERSDAKKSIRILQRRMLGRESWSRELWLDRAGDVKHFKPPS